MAERGFRTAKDNEAPPRYGIAAVDRAASILETFADGRALTQAEISRAAGLSEATTLRYLASLSRNGLVERDAHSGRYALGLRLFQLGERALGTDARHAALPVMRKLSEGFHETVNLAVRNANNLVLIEAVESTQSIRRGASIGDVDVWHASALGKAILAALPESEAREMVDGAKWVRRTGRTHTTWRALCEDLAKIRERGYAVDDEEGEGGLRCVGAAVHDRHGRPLYALSVSGPANRMDDDAVREIGRAVEEAAASISARIGFTLANRA
jgi:DNA-binding IclR family transcriptional regulator